jgi:hypothetical protein
VPLTDAANQCCRLCGGGLCKKFTKRLLGKYDVDYLECEHCLSLQTTEPFWLSETYGGTLPNLDYGAARRAMRTCALVLMSTAILGISRKSRVLDFGGGDGFVCRLLRDTGFEAYVFDRYAKNAYAHGFSREPSDRYDVVCAIEVFEHLATPNVELAVIFSSQPQVVVIATDSYHGQGPDWPYIGSDQGGHVFFYSAKAMSLIGARYGYNVLSHDSSTIFFKGPISRIRRAALALSLRPLGLLFGRLWAQLIRPRRDTSQSAVAH